MNNEIQHSFICRIKRMEQLYDFLMTMLQSAPDKLQSTACQNAIETLSEYYSSGDWLHDYELDEAHLLPPDLKKGVLSQDGLYNLLYEMKDTYN